MNRPGSSQTQIERSKSGKGGALEKLGAHWLDAFELVGKRITGALQGVSRLDAQPKLRGRPKVPGESQRSIRSKVDLLGDKPLDILGT
jgi:hypothetical protein